ncbi:MAG: hypothetical protein COB04_07185 [Gammaproteobacteria bacterium]|nr:MAG: hypothetical protein COB04_07185 [Gammaproteobacteria bacterium]
MPDLRAMCFGDLNNVVKVIHAHDEDDGEAAEADYRDAGFENQYVLEKEGQIVGVTGYKEVPSADQCYWLSWTYLQPSHQGQGLGKAMLLELLDILRSQGARKIFVKVSDYEDPEDGKIYQQALQVYQGLGFVEEVVSDDFYDEGENQIILGLYLRDDKDQLEQDPEVGEEKPIISFDGLFEIAETEGAYTFSWVVKETRKLFGKRNFSVEDLQIGLQSVQSEGGRKVFLTFPSNLPLIHSPLQSAGFKYVGQLQNYYEHGVHEFHFSHDLHNLENTPT